MLPLQKSPSESWTKLPKKQVQGQFEYALHMMPGVILGSLACWFVLCLFGFAEGVIAAHFTSELFFVFVAFLIGGSMILALLSMAIGFMTTAAFSVVNWSLGGPVSIGNLVAAVSGLNSFVLFGRIVVAGPYTRGTWFIIVPPVCMVIATTIAYRYEHSQDFVEKMEQHDGNRFAAAAPLLGGITYMVVFALWFVFQSILVVFLTKLLKPVYAAACV